MADHPLRPATDHRLGRPLPHQLANPTRAPPGAINLSHAVSQRRVVCGISPAFAGLSPTPGQVPTRYSPVRHSWIAPRVRLACIRHAASVRSEPGSNSQVSLGRHSTPPPSPGTARSHSRSESTYSLHDAQTHGTNGAAACASLPLSTMSKNKSPAQGSALISPGPKASQQPTAGLSTGFLVTATSLQQSPRTRTARGISSATPIKSRTFPLCSSFSTTKYPLAG